MDVVIVASGDETCRDVVVVRGNSTVLRFVRSYTGRMDTKISARVKTQNVVRFKACFLLIYKCLILMDNI